jgi:hypothetical protein
MGTQRDTRHLRTCRQRCPSPIRGNLHPHSSARCGIAWCPYDRVRHVSHYCTRTRLACLHVRRMRKSSTMSHARIDPSIGASRLEKIDPPVSCFTCHLHVHLVPCRPRPVKAGMNPAHRRDGFAHASEQGRRRSVIHNFLKSPSCGYRYNPSDR